MAVEAKVPLVAVLGTGSLLTLAWAPTGEAWGWTT